MFDKNLRRSEPPDSTVIPPQHPHFARVPRLGAQAQSRILRIPVRILLVLGVKVQLPADPWHLDAAARLATAGARPAVPCRRR